MSNPISHARGFARWALSLAAAPPPPAVTARVTLHLIDAIGCALAARRKGLSLEATRIAAPTAGQARASILGTAGVFDPASAAFANGALCHGLDFDDTHGPAVAHVTTAVAPAALAVAEAEGRTGKECLHALIAGAEIVCRIGMARRNEFHLKGFHPTSVCGVFGAAVAAGLLLRLNEDQLVNALGLAGSFASGIFAYLSGTSNPKPLHAAHAARDGVLAAQLAQAGATGPESVFECKFGLYDAFLGSPESRLAGLLPTLGRDWQSARMSIKPYPACHAMHACLDAAAAIVNAHRLAAADIARIQVFVSSPRDVNLVLEPFAEKIAPQTATVGKFSLPYSLAHLLVYGELSIDAYDPARLQDPRIRALAAKVGYEIKAFTTADHAIPGAAEVTTTAGLSYYVERLYERGGPEEPLSEDAILSKFRLNVGDLLPAPRTEELLAALSSITSLPGVQAITGVH